VNQLTQAIGGFCDWLAATPISLVIQNVVWIIPMIQSAHIASVAIVVGSVLMIDMKLLGLAGSGSTMTAQLRRYTPWIWSALAVLFCTGLVLICAEPRRELLNAVFLSKMALIVFILLSTIAFERVVCRNASRWSDMSSSPVMAKVFAVASLGVWIAIIVCGRWIAYVEHG